MVSKLNSPLQSTAPSYVAPIKTATDTPANPANAANPAASPVAPVDCADIDQHAQADFPPTAEVCFPEAVPEIVLPSLDDPVTGILTGPELKGRLQALQAEVTVQLEKAHSNHDKAIGNLQTAGFQNDSINGVLRTQHAIDTLNQIQALLKLGNPDTVQQLQKLIKSSATSEATGSGMGIDNKYGNGTDSAVVDRIRNPESNYVDRDFGPRDPRDEFVYQFGEVGDGGSAMEAQGNCGPASMAMLIERLGGDAPSMREIRQDANAKTGSKAGTYALDSDQVERGLQTTLAEQGIDVDTDTQLFKRNDADKLITAMRAGLAAGDEMTLLTSNLESGGKGHYIVINKVNDDGSIVVHDPQSENGKDRTYTQEQLQEGLRVRAAYGLETRLISVRPSLPAPEPDPAATPVTE